MKKMIWAVAVFGFVIMGAARGYAVPSIDGLLGAGEWDNIGYTYYLNVIDPNEPDVTPDTMDIFRVTLLQELGLAAGGTETTASTADDGVYLLIQNYVTPATLEDPDGLISQKPVVAMEGDFFGNGTADAFNIFLRHRNTTPLNGVNDPLLDSVTFCLGSATFCDPDGPNYLSFDGVVGFYGSVSARDRDPDVYEYFLPTGGFGTPVAPFPGSFIGTILFDNGNAGPNTSDDIVMGTIIPEPGTMFLFGGGLLGILGFQLRRHRLAASI